jgi:mRNA deadenylase 3'-5' endonuclease subunit Ccr4
LRGFKDNIEHFLKEGRGWFPKILPKRILEHISEVRPGPRKGPPYAQATKGSLRVMCYNVLAPSLVSAVEYHGVDQDHIEWKNRLEMIKREI